MDAFRNANTASMTRQSLNTASLRQSSSAVSAQTESPNSACFGTHARSGIATNARMLSSRGCACDGLAGGNPVLAQR